MTRANVVKAILYLPLYILCIVFASALWKTPAALSLCYAVMSGVMLLRWHTRSDIVYFFLAFVLGPAGEFVAIHYGAWRYTEPAILIPIWLPLAWGISGLFLKKATEALSGAGKVEPHNTALNRTPTANSAVGAG